jgi:hypothetical protein
MINSTQFMDLDENVEKFKTYGAFNSTNYSLLDSILALE